MHDCKLTATARREAAAAGRESVKVCSRFLQKQTAGQHCMSEQPMKTFVTFFTHCYFRALQKVRAAALGGGWGITENTSLKSELRDLDFSLRKVATRKKNEVKCIS